VRFLAAGVLFLLLAAPSAAAAQRSIVDVPVRTVKAGQGTIGYRALGHGPPLVLIMGLSGSMDAWPPSLVNALAAHRRVITFDNEGIRRTTLGPGTLSIRRMADDTASLIRRLRLGRTDVLGWSMGGMIAQSLTRRHPRRVRRLVLAATAPGNGRATMPGTDVVQALVGGSANVLDLLFPPGRATLGTAFVRQVSSYPNAQPAAPPAVTRSQLNAANEWLLGRDPSGRPLSRLTLPVLVGGGALDRLLPAPNQRHLARRLPNATLRMYRHAAHGFLFQYRKRFVRAVHRFLRR
jgi:pimeloyl-ACP methyl ester carboxylesterase